MTLAEKLAAAPPAARSTRKGPIAACDIYGPGDVAAYHAIQQRRANGEYWADVQRLVDQALGVEKPIRGDNFRYHWSGKCAHWDGIDLATPPAPATPTRRPERTQGRESGPRVA